ncbi:MAG: hypothetical protein RL386_2208 [Bacteroidota bacterium]|jgi:hypothetical protein
MDGGLSGPRSDTRSKVNRGSVKSLLPPAAAENFLETHHFHDFAKRNRENDASLKA